MELADLPKIIDAKLDQGEDRLTQTLAFPSSRIYTEIHPKPFTKYYDGMCSYSKCKRQRLTQIRPSPHDQNNGERKA